MQRRDVLRAAGAGLGLGVLGTALPATTHAHPGPYRPFDDRRFRGAKEAVVADDGHTVYIAATDGFVVADVSDPEHIVKVHEESDLMPDRETGPLTQIYDVKTDGDRLLVAGPAHGRAGDDDTLMGALVYDVADPQDPVFLDFFETDYPIHNCDVADGYAYLTGNLGDDTAMVIVDVSGEEAHEAGRWYLTDEDDAWADVTVHVRSIHDIYVHEDVAYVAHWDAGTWIVDVADPADPSALASVAPVDPDELVDTNFRESGFQLPGNSHYCAVNDDATILGVGEEAWDTDPEDDHEGGPGGITLYDITDLDDVTELARIDAPPTPDPTITGVWTTSHNFDFHGDRLYTSWYRGGVKIHDISTPSSPTELAWWRKPDEASFWTAQYAPGPNGFIASSRRDPPLDDPAGAALYTFPDHPGEQEDPPSFEPTTTTTDEDGSNGTHPTTTTTSTTTTTTTTTTSTTSTTTADSPGFGIPSAVAALGGLGLAWRRRTRDGE